MFRRTRPSPVAWEEPAPPARAVALAFAGLAGTISLVVGVLMWAGSAASQPRTFDSGAAAVAPAARLDAVPVPAAEAPLSPVPLPPVPVAPPSTVPATTQPFTPQTAAAGTLATNPPVPTSAPVTAPTTSPSPTTTTVAATTTSISSSTVPTTTAATTTLPMTTTTTMLPTTTTTTTTASTTAPPAGATLWAAVRADPALSRFADLVEQGGVAASFEVAASHTVIAPDDAAIAAYASTPAGAAELATPQTIRAFVLRHLVLDELDAAALFALDGVQVASGEWVPIDAAARTVGGAELISVDVRADNGVMHVAAAVVLAGTPA